MTWSMSTGTPRVVQRGSAAVPRVEGERQQDVPMKVIRHSDRVCYLREGHGGRPVESWPIYRFFRQYVSGDTDRAEHEFCGWYHEQFVRYRLVPKRLGGMRGGSLARALETGNGRPIADNGASGNGDPDDRLREVITLRVRQRFALVDSIRTHGYIPEWTDPVIGIRRKGHVYLEGGHHRAAALLALGWDVLPATLVFSSHADLRLWRWYRVFRRVLGMAADTKENHDRLL